MSIIPAGTSRFLAAIFVACFAPAAVAAEPASGNYPSKPIRLIVPQPPSGTVDMLARMIGQKLAEALRQQVVIDNRGGASGTIGSDLVAKAPADGYTILMTMTSHTTTPSMYAKLPYDAINDFVPVTMVTSAALILVVNPALPVHSIKDLVAYAKARPGQLNFTSAAIGSGGHLGGELLKGMTGIAATHVPYRGTGPAIIALIANEVQFMFAGLLPAQAQVKVNRLRAIAVTSAKRSSFMPELPTVAESGLPGFEVVGWYGVLAPAGTPAAIVNRLHAEIIKILAQPEIRDRIAGEGAEVVGDTPAQFAAFLKADIARWAPLIKQSGARLD
jgi:tripartite-type tricarboxylate transporter receptor subunit TctC